MRRLAAFALLVSVCACNRTSLDVLPPEELPPDVYGEAAGTDRSASLVVFLVDGNRLVRVGRSGGTTGSEEEIAVRELLAGPTSEEAGQGISTRIPEVAEVHSVRVEDEVAYVDLDRSFFVVEDAEADRHEFILRTAQVVWTLDELPNVNAVRILRDGQEVGVWDQEGRVVVEPVARGRYRRFAPKSDRVVSEAPLQID